VLHALAVAVERRFDRLDDVWHGTRARHAVAGVLIAAFGLSLVAVELERRGLLPSLGSAASQSHFLAVQVAFYLLLSYEVVSLVLGLARSVANAAGKQLEIFSLILLRRTFEEFGHLDDPVRWDQARDAVGHMLSDAGGALLIFVVLAFYYAAQRHLPLSGDAQEVEGFVRAKKAIALGLLAVFAGLAVRSGLAAWLSREPFRLFEAFYTVLIFADIAIVLLSLRHSARYEVVFRNSGLAVATVLLRLALSAPPYLNAALGCAAALFALGLTLAYNRLAPALGARPGG